MMDSKKKNKKKKKVVKPSQSSDQLEYTAPTIFRFGGVP